MRDAVFLRLRSVFARRKIEIALATALGLAAFVFHGAAQAIFDSWHKDEYSYAYLVPPLALLLSLHRLAAKPVAPQPSAEGFVLFLGAVFLDLLGQFSGLETLPQYGFLLALFGLVWICLGRALFLRLFPCLFYLFFALPLPTNFYISLSAKLQLFSSALGGSALQALGLSVYREGNIIDLGAYKLQVIEACNGLRYLFPLLGFGYLVVLLYRDAFWKKAALFFSAIPLALLLNVLRIVFIGLTVSWGYEVYADGFLHAFEGWVAFSFCVLLLFGEAALLSRLGPTRGGLDLAVFDLPRGPFLLPSPKTPPSVWALLLCLAGLAVAQDAGAITPKPEPFLARTPFALAPLTLGAWHGAPEPLDPAATDLLKASDTFLATFKNEAATASVNLFVAYYASQRNDTRLHSPEMCLPGNGWTVSEDATFAVPLDNERPLLVHRAIIEKGGVKQLVYYWFTLRGRALNPSLSPKPALLWSALTTGRTDSALFRLVTPLVETEPRDAADRRLRSFLTEAAPLLKPSVPDLTLGQ